MQPALFDLHRPLAYQRDSATSKAAAVKAESFAPVQRRRLLNALRWRGPEGLTQREACEQLSIARHSLTFRFRELERDGLIVRTTRIRGGCLVFVCVEAQ